jgi:hypothetical protein
LLDVLRYLKTVSNGKSTKEARNSGGSDVEGKERRTWQAKNRTERQDSGSVKTNVRCGAEDGRTQRTGQREHGEGDREGEKDRSGGTAVVIAVIAGARTLRRDDKNAAVR